MSLQCCFGGTLNLLSIPSTIHSSSLRSSTSICSLKTLTVTLSRTSAHRLPFLIRALSSTTVVDSTATASLDHVVKPQWKAAIDFKSILENKSAVAENLKKRNSNSDLELVIELYERLLELQKLWF